MGRPCTCEPFCDRCSNGKCDCNCTNEQLIEHETEKYRKRLKEKLGTRDAKRYEELARRADTWPYNLN